MITRPPLLRRSQIPWQTTYDLTVLAVAALGMRLAYLALASGHLGFEAFAQFAPDSQFYHYVAEHIQHGHARGPSVMLMVGPGYGFLLALLQWIPGPDLLYPILFNILLGCAGVLLIYGIAALTTGNRWVALTAGCINAFSLTAVSVSTHILTDQPLFTLYAAALFCFILGYERGQRRWFVAAGLCAAAAAMVRATGQMAIPFFALLGLVLPLRDRFLSRWQLVSRAGLACVIAGAAVFAWSFRNYVKEDQFVFSTIGMLTVRHCLVAQAMAEDDATLIQEYRARWGEEDGESDLVRYRGAYARAKARVNEALRIMPGRLFHYFFFNVQTNLRASNDLVGIQISELAPAMKSLNDFVWETWGYVLLWMAIAGILILAVFGRTAAAWILGSHYVVFTLICGSSFWQGSRLHYTAEIAWAILVPAAILLPLAFMYRRLAGTSVQNG